MLSIFFKLLGHAIKHTYAKIKLIEGILNILVHYCE